MSISSRWKWEIIKLGGSGISNVRRVVKESARFAGTQLFKGNGWCVFISPRLPCQFCQTRGIETFCIKLWGEKTEQRLGRPLPTPDEEIIDPHDVLLLQYAYSERFAYVTGWKLQFLLTKFGVAFAPSINSVSLRHAILACMSLYVPTCSHYDRTEFHSNLSCEALKRRTCENINEGDFFAACLLAYLACLRRDTVRFQIHLNGVIAIMKEFVRGTSRYNHGHYTAFWPLARDLLLEGSRRVASATNPILYFCYTSRKIHGYKAFVRRVTYMRKLLDSTTICVQ